MNHYWKMLNFVLLWLMETCQVWASIEPEKQGSPIELVLRAIDKVANQQEGCLATPEAKRAAQAKATQELIRRVEANPYASTEENQVVHVFVIPLLEHIHMAFTRSVDDTPVFPIPSPSPNMGVLWEVLFSAVFLQSTESKAWTCLNQPILKHLSHPDADALRAAAVHCNPTANDIRANAAAIRAAIERSRRAGRDAPPAPVVRPENASIPRENASVSRPAANVVWSPPGDPQPTDAPVYRPGRKSRHNQAQLIEASTDRESAALPHLPNDHNQGAVARCWADASRNPEEDNRGRIMIERFIHDICLPVHHVLFPVLAVTILLPYLWLLYH
ncbi:MAG: hypothetical protein LBI20_02695 [Holosporales bacterium]|nr:hypothetical protein [Holosporales bacterium]